MISHFVQSLGGVDIFGTTSLVVSVLLFVGIAIWTVRVDKDYIRRMKDLPLDNGTGEHEQLQRTQQ